jgi:hypothetical protein
VRMVPPHLLAIADDVIDEGCCSGAAKTLQL